MKAQYRRNKNIQKVIPLGADNLQANVYFSSGQKHITSRKVPPVNETGIIPLWICVCNYHKLEGKELCQILKESSKQGAQLPSSKSTKRKTDSYGTGIISLQLY